jgi:hypothetical protein
LMYGKENYHVNPDNCNDDNCSGCPHPNPAASAKRASRLEAS